MNDKKPTGRPKSNDNSKKVRIVVYFTEEQDKELRTFLKEHKITSLTGFIREAIRNEMKIIESPMTFDNNIGNIEEILKELAELKKKMME